MHYGSHGRVIMLLENKMLSIYIPIVSTLYYALGLVLYLYNFKHVVISRRLPYLLIVDQILNYSSILMLFCESPCILYHLAGILSATITIVRMTYIYQFIGHDHKWLQIINRMLWTADYRLKTGSMLILLSLSMAVSLVTTVAYSAIVGNFKSTCSLYPYPIMFIQMYALVLIQVVYITSITAAKLGDKIGMKLEIAGRCFTYVAFSVLFLLVTTLLDQIPFEYYGITQKLNFIFWGTWFPCIYIYIVDSRFKIIRLSGSDYNVANLEEMGKAYYCSENIHFLAKYSEYLNNDRDNRLLEGLLNDFVELNSKFQLNLNQEIRNKVLSKPKYIELVYDEVVEMVSHNLLPFIIEL
eukprot:NODE_41_length_29768_cov_0.533924.p7 type:complete len:354 gc:universal NODE_41_length_29768_cov_0.533924:8006-9067(+)